MFLAQNNVFIIGGVVIFLFILLIQFVVVSRIGSLWFQANMSGVRLRPTELIGMALRKVDAKLVVKMLILATQADVSLSRVEVERAYLQGLDIEKVTLAMIRAKKEGIDVSFQDLVDAELENRLEEKLGQ